LYSIGELKHKVILYIKVYSMRFINLSLVSIASKHGIVYPTPSNLNYFWGFRSISGFLLVWQVLSGVLLVVHHSLEVSLAFDSIEYIMWDVSNGWLIASL
jgi:quinol-cytochrome oxidoreductase complex cytochrome b subunit